ncbi:FG-GAP-like repeat-containing protein [Planctomicrobium sp. SH664]|uniref:FG-GAP-like repeat-containing protein n=1 Tax=Planctomicrobium sp. SH664 TaxID=3448125 RepID=UPI003F5B4232
MGWLQARVGDFNGDGRSDVVAWESSTKKWHVFISTGTSFQASAWATWTFDLGAQNIAVGDFNGDGRDDVAARTGTGDWRVAISTGNRFETRNYGNWLGGSAASNLLTGDFNGDGRDDLAAYVSTQWHISFSSGESFSTSTSTVAGTNVGSSAVAFDINHDGKADLVQQVTGGDKVAFWTTGSTWTTSTLRSSSVSSIGWLTPLTSALTPSVKLIDYDHRWREVMSAYDLVRNTIGFTPSYGWMRGIDAVASTKVGNAWDQQNYFNSLITSVVETRFVSSTVRFYNSTQIAQLNNWLGTESLSASIAVLSRAGLNPQEEKVGDVTTGVKFAHAWLVAYMPGPTGQIWQPLDPSFKSYTTSLEDIAPNTDDDVVTTFDEDFFGTFQQNLSFSADFASYAGTKTLPGSLTVTSGSTEPITGSPAYAKVWRNSSLLFNEAQGVNGHVVADIGVPGNIDFSMLFRLNGSTSYELRVQDTKLRWFRHGVDTGSSGQELIASSNSTTNTTLQSNPNPAASRVLLEARISGDTLYWKITPQGEAPKELTLSLRDATPAHPTTGIKIIEQNRGYFGIRTYGSTYISLYHLDIDLDQIDTRIFDAIGNTSTSPNLGNHMRPQRSILGTTSAAFPALPYAVVSAVYSTSWADAEVHRVRLTLKNGGTTFTPVILRLPEVNRQNIYFLSNPSASSKVVLYVGSNTTNFATNGQAATLTAETLLGGSTIQTDELYVPANGIATVAIAGSQYSAQDVQNYRTLLNNVQFVSSPNTSEKEAIVIAAQQLAAADYAHRSARDLRLLALSTGAIWVEKFATIGLVTSERNVSTSTDRQFYYAPTKLRMDQPQQSYIPVPIDGSSADATQSAQQERSQAAMFLLSQLEGLTLGAITGTHTLTAADGFRNAVSTGDTILRLQRTSTGTYVDLGTSTVYANATALRATLDHSTAAEDVILAELDSVAGPISRVVTVPLRRVRMEVGMGSVFFVQDHNFSYPVFESLVYSEADNQLYRGGVAQDTPTADIPTKAVDFAADLFSGILRRTDTDVVLPSIGPRVAVERTYISRKSTAPTDDYGFGINVAHSYSDTLEISGNNLTWMTNQGARYQFLKLTSTTFAVPDVLLGTTLTLSGSVYTLTDQHGLTRTFTTSGSSRAYLTKLQDRNGNVLSINRSSGKIQTVQDTTNVGSPLTLLTYTYTGNQITSVTDNASRTWTYTYQDAGSGNKRLIGVAGPGAGTAQAITTYAYFPSGNELQGLLSSVTAPGGSSSIPGLGQTAYNYYRNGRLLSETRPDGGVLGYSYDIYNHTTTVVDQVGSSTVTEFSPSGLMRRQILPDGTSVAYEWDLQIRQQTKVTDSRGRITRSSYNVNTGTLMSQTSPDGLTTSYEYEVVSQPFDDGVQAG